MSVNKKQKKEDSLSIIKKQNLFLLKKIILLVNLISKIKHELPLIFPKYVKDKNFGILRSEQHRRAYSNFVLPCLEIQKQLTYCSLYTFLPKVLNYMWITEHHVRNILFSLPFRSNFFNLTVIDNEIKMIHTEQVRIGKILSYFPDDKEYRNWVESFIFNNVDRDYLYNKPVTYFHIKAFSFENFVDGYKYFLNELPPNSKKLIGYTPKYDIQYYLNKAFKSSLRALLFNFYNFEDKKLNEPKKVYDFFNQQRSIHQSDVFSQFVSSINSCEYDVNDDEDENDCRNEEGIISADESEQPSLISPSTFSFRYVDVGSLARSTEPDQCVDRRQSCGLIEDQGSSDLFTLS